MEISCRSCGAELVLAEGLRTATCPYCSSSSVVELPPRPDRPRPTYALGFSLTNEAARAHVGRWLKNQSLFAPSAIRNAALEDVRGIYVPAYLYSAVAHSSYSADIGEHYTVTYTVMVNGKAQVRTRIETEWRPLEGRHSDYLADIVVTASRGLQNVELERIEPFDLRVLRRYDAAIVSGWIAEDPSMTQTACIDLARQEAMDELGRRLEQFMPGDKYRDLEWNTDLEKEVVELVLLPVWVLAARWHKDRPPVRVVVNGQTGQVHGKVPLSTAKIVATIVAVLIVLAAVGLIGAWKAGALS